MKKRLVRLWVWFGLLSLAGLAGCGAESFQLTQQPVSQQPGVTLTGIVRARQSPVSGAAVALYAAGSAGNGQGAVNLLGASAVIADTKGAFSLSGDYTCPSAQTQVYVVARGGNPGLAAGTSNAALVLMAALGDCGALTASTPITVNEVTSVAAAWALAPFLSAGATVGSSATNASGLRNAFLIAANLADSSTGETPGRGLPPGAALETAKIATLADVIANCAASGGGNGCSALFEAATAGASRPANTLDAALNIVRNPGANVAAVYQARGTQTTFAPVLPQVPHDWTLSITYGGCAMCGGLSAPGALAIDAGGDVWVANGTAAVLSEFSPAGMPVAPAGFPGAGLRLSHGLTIDTAGNVWVTNELSVAGAASPHYGSISEFNAAGQELSGFGYTTGGIYYPQAAAADTNGLIWVADYGDSSASVLSGMGAPAAPNGFAISALPFTQSVALDGAHNAWFGIQQGVVRVTAAGVVTRFPCCEYPTGVAIDGTGNVWLADYAAGAVVELDAQGNVRSSTPLDTVGAEAAQLLAIDGAGNIWTANFRGDSVSELSGPNSVLLSPAGGFGQDAPLSEPYGIAVDASGNLWLSNAASSTVTQVVGLAAPVRTPTLGPPVQP